jgi:putative chitinase
MVTTLSTKYKSLLGSYGVNTPLRLSHFFAQIDHESGLKPLQENLNYSESRLLEIFKYDFDTDKNRILSDAEKLKAKQLARKPEQIANFVYANQNGNGNEASGDGWKFRGRGFLQITGRSNYMLLSKDTKIDYINKPDLLLNEVDAMISALRFWNKHNLNVLADKDDVMRITKIINGGSNGITERKELLNKYKKLYNV